MFVVYDDLKMLPVMSWFM